MAHPSQPDPSTEELFGPPLPDDSGSSAVVAAPGGVAHEPEVPVVESPAAEVPVAESPDDAVFVPQTGRWVSGGFRRFYEQYGVGHCGYPISDASVENGLRSQYFQRLALEEHAPGQVRLKPLGEAWLAAGHAEPPRSGQAAQVVDMVDRLPAHPTKRYAQRPLSHIRYIVIHHTGADPSVTCEAIAREHVDVNGWPGMAYHYVVSDHGVVYRTQDLVVASYHARQFNPVSVGVALAGDFSRDIPPPAQIEATADLIARLLDDLGLPPSCVRAHREVVPTSCPGDTFGAVWKAQLMRLTDARLRDIARQRAEPVAARDE